MVRKAIMTVACFLALAGTWWFLKPKPPLDLSNDEEPFRSMELPPKEVIAGTYMDHGSAAMRLIDQRGVEYWITFPIDYDGILDSHPKAYQGEINGKMILLKDPQRAKAIVVRLLRDYAKEDEFGQKKIVLRTLTHRTIPFRVRRFIDELTDK